MCSSRAPQPEPAGPPAALKESRSQSPLQPEPQNSPGSSLTRQSAFSSWLAASSNCPVPGLSVPTRGGAQLPVSLLCLQQFKPCDAGL